MTNMMAIDDGDDDDDGCDDAVGGDGDGWRRPTQTLKGRSEPDLVGYSTHLRACMHACITPIASSPWRKSHHHNHLSRCSRVGSIQDKMASSRKEVLYTHSPTWNTARLVPPPLSPFRGLSPRRLLLLHVISEGSRGVQMMDLRCPLCKSSKTQTHLHQRNRAMGRACIQEPALWTRACLEIWGF